ncbi:GIY-YIG nuclease family protein [Promicromonospora sukumoe]
MAHMYILRCSDGSFYVGSTVDLERRLGQHNEGEGAAYTRRRRPVALVHSEEFSRIDDAHVREKQVQGWSRAKRLALIEGRLEALPDLARSRTTSEPAKARQGLDKLDQR